MKKITLFFVLLSVFLIWWCDKSHNFMDVENENAKEDLKNLVWDWNFFDSNTNITIPKNLSWAMGTAKEYANKYYEDTLEGYVNVAKEGISWAKESFKWYYNSWLDELNQMVTDKVNWVISWELNKYKIK